jgi:frataxin-like iron-binding protein CyaY
MAFRTITQGDHTIDTPGFDDRVFTGTSAKYLALPDAVHFANARNTILQSAAEAVAFRIAANGHDFANDYHITRTAALYFRDGDRCSIAFDDSDDPEQNILLARSQEGYDAHRKNGKWLVSKSDPCITSALERAARTGRIVAAPQKNLVQLLMRTDWSGTSEYGNSPSIRAMIGDLSEPYARFFTERDYRTGHAWFLTPSNLQQLGVSTDTVEVRCVGVGGGCSDSSNLGAYGRCYGGGRARGVRKTSTENRGGA